MQFYIRLDVKPTKWEDRIILFTAFLVENKLQSSTVKSYLSTIRAVLAVEGFKLSEDSFLLTSLTRACQLNNNRVIHRFPIYRDLLGLLLRELTLEFEEKQQIYLLKLYRAMFVAAYYGLLRAGEIALGPHELLAKDVHIGKNKEKFLFILWTSKTHTAGSKPQMIKITSQPVAKAILHKKQNCPFAILREYVAIHPHSLQDTEQFFVF